MNLVMPLKCSNFTNIYYKWIGNIEGTRYSLLMELFGYRGPPVSKTGKNMEKAGSKTNNRQ